MYTGGIFSAIRSMVQSEGLLIPFRGMNVVAAGAGPAHALYFSSYEFSKRMLSNQKAEYHHVAHGIAGLIATLIHDGFMTPIDGNLMHNACRQTGSSIHFLTKLLFMQGLEV